MAGVQVASLYAKLGVDDSEFRQGMSGAQQQMETTAQSARGFGSVIQGVLSTAGGFLLAQGIGAATQAVGGLVSGMIGGNAEFERYNQQFTVLLKDSDAAKQRLADLAEFGAKTPFELPEVVQADKILQGFGLHAEDTAQKFGKSGEDIRRIAGDVASGSGASFQEMATYLGKFASGATGEAIARFQELGIVTRDQLRGMGVEFSKSGELVSPLPQAMTALLSIMDEKYGGMMDKQSTTFEGMLSNLQDWVGQATRTMGAPIFDALKEQMSGLLVALSNPAVLDAIKQIGATLGSMVSAGIGAVQSFVGSIQGSFADASSSMGGLLASAKSAFEGIGTALSTVLPAIGQLAGAIGETLVAAFNAVSPLIKAAYDAVGELAPQFGTVLAGALSSLAAFLRDTVVPAIETFGAWLKDNLPTAIGAVKTAWDTVLKPALQAVYDFITNTVVPILTTLADWLKDNIPTAIAAIQTAWNTVLKPALQAAYDFISGTVVPILSTLVDWFKDNLPGAIGAVKTAWDTVLKPILTAIRDFIADPVLPILSDLAGAVGAALKAAFEVAQTAWNVVLKPILSALRDFIADPVLPILGSLAQAVGPALETAFGVMRDAYNNVIKPALTALRDFIADPVLPVLSKLAGAVGAGLETASGLAKSAWDNVLKPALDAIVAFVRDTLIPGITNIQTKWGEIWDTIKSKITSIGPDLVAAAAGIITDIIAKFTTTDWGAVGQGVVDGIITGIQNGVAGLREAAASAANNLLEAAKKALDIASPSKVMETEVGAPIVAGIVAGLQNGEPALVDAAKRLVAQLVSIMADLAAPVVEGVRQFEDHTLDSATSLANISWRLVEFLRNANAALAEVSRLSVINKQQRHAMVLTVMSIASFMVDLAKPIHRLMNDLERDIAPSLTELNQIFKTTFDILGGTVALVDALVDKVGGTRIETVLNDAAARQWIINLAQAMTQWANDIASAVDDINITVNADALPALKLLSDILSPIKSAIDNSVGIVTTLLKEVGGTAVETTMNDVLGRQWVINLAQSLVTWANDIAAAADDVKVTVNEDALPGLKLLGDVLSPVSSAMRSTLDIIAMLNSEWDAPKDVAASTKRLTGVGVAVAGAFLEIASTFTGKVTPAAEQAAKGIDMAEGFIKTVYDLGKDMSKGIAELPANYEALTVQLVTLGKAIAKTFIETANNFDVVVGPGAEALLAVFAKLDKFYSGLDKSINAFSKLTTIPEDAAETTRKVAQLAVDIGKAYLTVANAFDMTRGEGAANLESIITSFADVVKDAKTLLKTLADFGTTEVTSPDMAPTFAVFAAILEGLQALSVAGGAAAGTSFVEAFASAIEAGSDRMVGALAGVLGQGIGVGALAGGLGGLAATGAAAAPGAGLGGQVTINNVTNNTKSINVSVNASTAEAGRAATVSVYGLVMY